MLASFAKMKSSCFLKAHKGLRLRISKLWLLSSTLIHMVSKLILLVTLLLNCYGQAVAKIAAAYITSLVSPHFPPQTLHHSKNLLILLRIGLVHLSLRVHTVCLQDPFPASAFPPLPFKAFQRSEITISLNSSL